MTSLMVSAAHIDDGVHNAIWTCTWSPRGGQGAAGARLPLAAGR